MNVDDQPALVLGGNEPAGEAREPEPGQADEMPPVAEVTEPTLPFDETQAGDELPIDQRPLP